MKNILSYQDNQFSGKEILAWADYQVRNQTSHQKQGQHILNKFGNIKLCRTYKVFTSYAGTGCGERIYKPLITK